ncbi:hypothetical protein [Desulfosarcina ovata]|uniref:hypothetical protein n=1 Tax=Desulfosarcina ovata TaxID=83564 RepID=UPI0012D2FDF2|nr:hypothetical protein [Desulfosarcina ovata]
MNVKDQMKNAKWWYSIYFKIDFILHLTFGRWHLAFSHLREWCVFRNGRFLILLAIALTGAPHRPCNRAGAGNKVAQLVTTVTLPIQKKKTGAAQLYRH